MRWSGTPIPGLRWRRTRCSCPGFRVQPMPDMPRAGSALCGVRLDRNGPVLYVDANGVDVAPDQLVVLQRGGAEAIARVVFSPAQLVSNEPSVSPEGKISRVAT